MQLFREKKSVKNLLVNDVHRRQIFFKLFELTILVVTISISRKKEILTMFSGSSYFKGLGNKIIGFVLFNSC